MPMSIVTVLVACGGDSHRGAIDPPAAPGAMAPQLYAHGDAVLATWLEPIDDRHRLRFSRWRRGGWSAPVTIVEGPTLVANWADTPMIAAGADGSLVASWAERSGSEPYAYDAVVARSVDGGATWRRLGALHRDGTPTEHGFVSLAPDLAGVRAIWLDGRATGKKDGATALRTASIGGAIGEDSIIDDRVCDCCGTALANTSAGAVIAYRDRSADDIRDIGIALGANGAWTTHGTVHDDGWKLTGCPVNGPAIATRGNHVAIAWFTGADLTSRVRAAFSSDGGQTFDAPLDVDAPEGDRAPIGRVGIVLVDDAHAIVTWIATRREAGEILARRVSRDGTRARELAIASTRATRDAGFPRMVLLGDELVVTWTEPGQPSKLRARALAIASLPTQPDHPIAPSTAPRAARPDTPLPTVSATLLDGSRTSTAALRGRLVLLNVWATWCEPCRHELPALAAVHRRYRERGLDVIALSIDREKSASEIAAFAKRFELPFPVWLDSEDRAASLLDARTLPVTLLVDAAGTIRWRRDGAIAADDPELAAAIDRLAPRSL